MVASNACETDKGMHTKEVEETVSLIQFHVGTSMHQLFKINWCSLQQHRKYSSSTLTSENWHVTIVTINVCMAKHQAERHDQSYARALWPTSVSKYIQEKRKLTKYTFFEHEKEKKCCEAGLCSHPHVTCVYRIASHDSEKNKNKKRRLTLKHPLSNTYQRTSVS